MNYYQEPKHYGSIRDENKDKSSNAPPSYIVESSSPLSSVSIPSPPTVSPTLEMYSKEMLYHNVSQLKVQNQASELASASAVTPPNFVHVPSETTQPSVSLPGNQCKSPIYAGVANDRNDMHLKKAVRSIQDLKQFLLSAPSQFRSADIIHQFKLPTEEKISCVRWNHAFCVTGTDIVRILAFRFSLFGRDIVNRKKFEEGVFSDLRNLKINIDATLENPKSELLEFLYKRHCVRTKKKQKVFFWYSVRHDQLFIDALERELKKDAALGSANQHNHQFGGPSSASTVALRDPALSFKYDASLPLTDQLREACDSMPTQFANIVSELTTANISSEYQQMPEEVFGGEGEACPSTPVQVGDKHEFDVPMMLTPYEKAVSGPHGKQDLSGINLYAQPHAPPLLQQPHTHAYMPSSYLYGTPPHNNVSVYHPTDPQRLPTSTSSNASLSPSPASLQQPPDPLDASDFPLDVLVKEDESLRLSELHPLTFEDRYTDFAHHNRPALQNGNNTLLLNDTPGLQTPELAKYDGQFSTQSGSHTQVPFFAPQSPDWDQYLYSESLGLSSSTGLHDTTIGYSADSGHHKEREHSVPRYAGNARVMKQPPYSRRKSSQTSFLPYVVDEF